MLLSKVWLGLNNFISFPGSYYSDALFYLSLGLHRIVDPFMGRAILIDCDVVFRSDVKRLFDEFERFVFLEMNISVVVVIHWFLFYLIADSLRKIYSDWHQN